MEFVRHRLPNEGETGIEQFIYLHVYIFNSVHINENIERRDSLIAQKR